jgi:hypothetical protein
MYYLNFPEDPLAIKILVKHSTLTMIFLISTWLGRLDWFGTSRVHFKRISLTHNWPGRAVETAHQITITHATYFFAVKRFNYTDDYLLFKTPASFDALILLNGFATLLVSVRGRIYSQVTPN